MQQRAGRGQPAVRVDDDPDRVRPLDVAGGEARLVEDGGAGPDDHRVAERAGPVQVDEGRAAVDVARVARAGGDEAVQGLAEDGDAAAGLPRRGGLGEEQLEQLAGRRAEPLQAARDTAEAPVDDHRGRAVGPAPHVTPYDGEGQLTPPVARVDDGPDRQEQPPGGTRPEDPGRVGASPVRSRAGTGRPARRRPRFVRFSTPVPPDVPRPRRRMTPDPPRVQPAGPARDRP